MSSSSREFAGDRIEQVLDRASGNNAAIGGIKVVHREWVGLPPGRLAPEDVYKIYAVSFRGAEHLKQVLAEAQKVVDSGECLAFRPAEKPSIAGRLGRARVPPLSRPAIEGSLGFPPPSVPTPCRARPAGRQKCPSVGG